MKGIPTIKFIGTGIAGLETLLSKPIMRSDRRRKWEGRG